MTNYGKTWKLEKYDKLQLTNILGYICRIMLRLRAFRALGRFMVITRLSLMDSNTTSSDESLEYACIL